MAERGRETLRHGPMKPFGLTNPHAPDVKPYAVVQLRQDNKLGTLFNMVGFQTKLKHGEQVRIFRTIPGLQNAEFARLGGLHRNTFLNSPKLLDANAAAQSEAALALCRPDHRLRGLCRIRRRRAAGRRALPPPSGAARPSCRRRRPRRMARCSRHITGGHIETIDAGPLLVPADEREFRPVPAARRKRRRRPARPQVRPRLRQEPGAQRRAVRAARSPISNAGSGAERGAPRE